METSFSLLLLLLILLPTTPSKSQPPSPSPNTTNPPPPPSSTTISSPQLLPQEELNNIIDALIGAGDFANWISIIANTIPFSPATTNAAVPLTATIFVPGNDALSHLVSSLNFDPFIIPYHIVPQRLTFAELTLFKAQTRLPTLLPGKTLIITNNSASNFTIDDSLVTHPDIFVNSPSITVHGMDKLLDYTVYGNGTATATLFPAVQEANKTRAPPPMIGGQPRRFGGCGTCKYQIAHSIVLGALIAGLGVKIH